jgi:hypothetical protein
MSSFDGLTESLMPDVDPITTLIILAFFVAIIISII